MTHPRPEGDDPDVTEPQEDRTLNEVVFSAEPAVAYPEALPGIIDAGIIDPDIIDPDIIDSHAEPAIDPRVVEITPTVPPEAYASWVELVERIQSGEIDGMEELYLLFSRGIRFYLCRQLGPQELDDKVHDTFVVVVQAIRRGELREPQRLMGFVRTVVRRQVAAHIDKVVHSRREQVELDSSSRVPDPRGNPEEAAIFRERTELLKRVLGELCDRDREILTRFYLHEQSQDQICTEMELTETQFRLLKSRAKARFGELGRKRLAHKTLHAVILRSSRATSH
jgi:RNA polymerase sigma-70 factor (ECF subfamily)